MAHHALHSSLSVTKREESAIAQFGRAARSRGVQRFQARVKDGASLAPESGEHMLHHSHVGERTMRHRRRTVELLVQLTKLVAMESARLKEFEERNGVSPPGDARRIEIWVGLPPHKVSVEPHAVVGHDNGRLRGTPSDVGLKQLQGLHGVGCIPNHCISDAMDLSGAFRYRDAWIDETLEVGTVRRPTAASVSHSLRCDLDDAVSASTQTGSLKVVQDDHAILEP